MANITGPATLSTIDLYTSYTTLPSGYQLGQLIEGDNGKKFRFALAGASALVVGNVLQSSAVDTQFTNMSVAAAVAGATSITVTNGTTTVSANQFDGGSLSIYTAGTIPVGQEYTIVGHTTGGSGASLTVELDRPLRAAMTTSAKVNMRRSPWSGVIQSPATTLTGSCAGVAIYAIPAAEYGWVQTGGVCSALSDGSSILVGSPIAVPSGTAGAVILGATNLMQIGQAMQAAASAKGIAVCLSLD
jgi:hypothetical protein